MTKEDDTQQHFSQEHGARGGGLGLGLGLVLGLFTIKDLFLTDSLQKEDILAGIVVVAGDMTVLGSIGMMYGSKLVRQQISDKMLDAEIAFRMYILRQ